MLNNLNSTLVEGTIIEDPKMGTDKHGDQVCTFPMASVHYSRTAEAREDDPQGKEVNYFQVQTRGSLARRCLDMGRARRGVRVVGRMRHARIDSPDSTIIAEVVEFRPEYVRDIDSPDTIRCDRCNKDITKEYYDLGGNCTECGDNLCKSCAGTWDENGRCESCQKKEKKL